MIRRPPKSTLTDTLFPYSTLFRSINLRAFGGSALTADIEVPKDGVDGSIPITYVPARNTIFLSLALGLAEARGARDLFIGVNRSEEHTSELQSLMRISYAVFCLKKKIDCDLHMH